MTNIKSEHNKRNSKMKVKNCINPQKSIFREKIMESENTDHGNNLKNGIGANNMPFITIGIPTYNRANYLGETIESALNQGYDNYEILIVDDGSDDDTEQIIRDMKCNKIRYIKKEHNGAPQTRNVIVKEAKGDFILWLGSDDILLSQTVADYIKVLQKYPDVDVIYGNLVIFNDHTRAQRKLEYPEWYGRSAELVSKIIEENVIPDGGSMVRKMCYEKYGAFNSRFLRAHDYEWWSRAVPGIKLKHSGRTVLKWRWHANNMSTGSVKVDLSYDANIVKDLLNRFSLRQLFPDIDWNNIPEKEAIAIAYIRAAIRLYHLRDFSSALKYLNKSENIYPSKQADKLRIQIEKAILLHSKKNSSEIKQALPHKLGSSSDNKLRISYLINTILYRSGGNQTLLAQANALSDRGYEVNVVTYTAENLDWFNLKANQIVVPQGQSMADFVPASDVVIATYFTNAHELPNINAPVKIYYGQGDQFIFQKNWHLSDAKKKALYNKLFKLSKESYRLPGVRFVANSYNLSSNAEKLFEAHTEGILPVCVEHKIFRPLTRAVRGSRLRILIVGPDIKGSEMEPLDFKGMEDIKKSLEILSKRYGNFTTIRMSSTIPEIFKHFPCEFYMAPSDEMKTFLYGTAHILIYASHYDSCPRPPLEAMAAGAAVVCTETPGALEYCRNNENSLLVPIKSPEAIADSVERLIHDHSLRERLIQGGYKTSGERPQEREWDELENLINRFYRASTGKEVENDSGSNKDRSSNYLQRLSQADHHLESGDAALAEKIYNDILNKDSNNIDALLGLSRCAAVRDETSAAMDYLQEIAKLDPDNAQAFNQIGLISLEIDDPENAKTFFATAIQKDPHSVDAQRNYAKTLIKLGDYENAIAAIMAILANHPNDVSTLMMMAELYMEAGKLTDAINFLEKVVCLDPYNKNYQKRLTDILKQNNDINLSAEILGRILERHPENAFLLNELGVVYWQQQHRDKALSYFEQAVVNDGDHPEHLKNLADAYLAEEKFEDGIQILMALMQKFPDDFEAFEKMANLYIENGNYDSARELIERFREKQPGHAYAGSILELIQYPEVYIAYQFLNQGELDTAENLFRDYLTHTPDCLPAKLGLGSIIFHKEQYIEAEKIYAEILNSEPENEEALLYMAKIKLAGETTGEFEELYSRHEKLFAASPLLKRTYIEYLIQKDSVDQAAEEIQHLLNENPGDQEIHILAGNLFYQQDKYEEAEKMFRNALTIDPANEIAKENLQVVLNEMIQ